MTKMLSKLTTAEIAKFEDVAEAAKWAKSADAAAVFYAAHGSHEDAQRVLEIGLRLKRRAGEILLPPGEGGKTPRAKGGRPKLVPGGNEFTAYREVLDEAGIGRTTAHEWQKLARVAQAKFEQYLTDALLWPDNYSIGGALRFAGQFYGRSDSVEWATPQWLFDLLDQEFNFHLDVCATPENAKCKRFFTKKHGALKQSWEGMCWMNPPYGNEISEWMKKARESANEGATVVCLVPGAYETEWFQQSAEIGEVRLISNGRVKWRDMTSAPFPSAIIILGPEVKPNVCWWPINQKQVKEN